MCQAFVLIHTIKLRSYRAEVQKQGPHQTRSISGHSCNVHWNSRFCFVSNWRNIFITGMPGHTKNSHQLSVRFGFPKFSSRCRNSGWEYWHFSRSVQLLKRLHNLRKGKHFPIPNKFGPCCFRCPHEAGEVEPEHNCPHSSFLLGKLGSLFTDTISKMREQTPFGTMLPTKQKLGARHSQSLKISLLAFDQDQTEKGKSTCISHCPWTTGPSYLVRLGGGKPSRT